MLLRSLCVLGCLVWCSAGIAGEPDAGQPSPALTVRSASVADGGGEPVPDPRPLASNPMDDGGRLEFNVSGTVEVKLPPSSPNDEEVKLPENWEVVRLVVATTAGQGGRITLRVDGCDTPFLLEVSSSWQEVMHSLAVTDLSGNSLRFTATPSKSASPKYLTIQPEKCVTCEQCKDCDKCRKAWLLSFPLLELAAGLSYRARTDSMTNSPDLTVQRLLVVANPTGTRWNCAGCTLEIRPSLLDTAVEVQLPPGDSMLLDIGANGKTEIPLDKIDAELYLPADQIPVPQGPKPYIATIVLPARLKLKQPGSDASRPKLLPGAAIELYHRTKNNGRYEWKAYAVPAPDGSHFPSGVRKKLTVSSVSNPVRLENGWLTYRIARCIALDDSPPGLIREMGKDWHDCQRCTTSCAWYERKTREESPRNLLLDCRAPAPFIEAYEGLLNWLFGEQHPGPQLREILGQIRITDSQIIPLREQVRHYSFDAGPLAPFEKDRIISGLRRKIAELQQIRIRQIDAFNALATTYHRFDLCECKVPQPEGQAPAGASAR